KNAKITLKCNTDSKCKRYKSGPLLVHASDKDSGRNAAIRYEVDDDHFSVNDHGDIEARKRLDADQKSQGYHIYRFNVTARDMGEPSLSAKALVHIRTENTNDEAPYFIPTRQYTAYVAEDAQGGTPIVTIQALDPDRDQVSYSFLTPEGEMTTTELFEIDKDTGLIKLRMGTKPEDLSQNGMHVYNLTVQAKDDGSCCDTASTVIHKEIATVLIGIADVNNNKPEFHKCSTYSSLAKVEEGIHKNGSVIIKVVATDDDSPPNGDIVYSLYYPKSESRKPFIIDPITGELRPSPYVMFDREKLPFEDVTVKATDKGERPLIGFCQFTVTVTDDNDNAPQFDRVSYETSISLNMDVGHSVVTVFADDRDAPPNARITYELKADETAGEEFADDPTYFNILKSESGEVTLTKSIPPEKTKFKFFVVANDNGSPEPQKSEVSVVINVQKSHQSAPRWIDSKDCPAQKEVNENVQVHSVFFLCRAVSGATPDNPISYSMSNGVKRSTNSENEFREFLEKRDGHDWVAVRNLKVLDYEKASNYTLTLTATDLRSGVTTDKQLRIFLLDKNDEVPRFTVDRFTGTIDEELTPQIFAQKSNNQPLTTVEAVDADSPGPQSEVRYRILKGPASNLFRIDERTGGIYPLAKFDREKNDSFILDVEARDGMDSDLPDSEGPNKDIVKVQIFIGDVNDNPPYFNKTSYNGRIAENAEIGQGVMTVKAHDADRDSNLKYDLKGKNSERIEFGVRADSGTIFVKEPLDFETRKEYSLTLLVTDGKHESNTTIFIHIEDV
uniref:Cadherin domain-containing protein n=1 Tax=Plectus sambesii TaxID=2011161 RepID=A0A914XSI8_9BILA